MIDTDKLIAVRGGGDIATGTIWTLKRAGYKVLILESDRPSAIRRSVSFGEAVYEKRVTVEGITSILAKDADDAKRMLEENLLPVIIDPEADCIKRRSIKPDILIDAIMAKKNIGTTKEMADYVIALGPGFRAYSRYEQHKSTCDLSDCDVVIETMRGHDLGRIITDGFAIKNTGIPGLIAGHSQDRVIHADFAGKITGVKKIGDTAKLGETLAYITDDQGKHEVLMPFDGLLRGIIRDGFHVTKGYKIADADPRISEYDNCFTISDKARCIGGSVLLAALIYLRTQKK